MPCPSGSRPSPPRAREAGQATRHVYVGVRPSGTPRGAALCVPEQEVCGHCAQVAGSEVRAQPGERDAPIGPRGDRHLEDVAAPDPAKRAGRLQPYATTDRRGPGRLAEQVLGEREPVNRRRVVDVAGLPDLLRHVLDLLTSADPADRASALQPRYEVAAVVAHLSDG